MSVFTLAIKYDLNQIPYDYTVEGINRFKGLDLLTECLKDYRRRFVTLFRRPWPKPSQRKRNTWRQDCCRRRLTNSWRKKRSKNKKEREDDTQLDAEFSRAAARGKKTFLSEQMVQRKRGNNRAGKTEDDLKKTGAIKGTFHAKMGTVKDKNGKDLTNKRD